MSKKILKFSLIFGLSYFILMSIAHFFSLKYPFLFIYYDTPYYAYQDKIISFSVSAYVALFYLALRDYKNIPTLLTILAITILGLVYINLSPDLLSVIGLDHSIIKYWIQTSIISIYVIVLFFLYKRNKAEH